MRAVLLLAVLAPLVAVAQEGTLYVGVQRPNGEAVVGATVQLGERGASTDAEGLAAFEGVGPGRHTVRVSFVGSRTEEVTVDLTAPGPWGLAVDLTDTTDLLGGVVVEADDLRRTRLGRDGFFRRQRRGGGIIFTTEDPALRNAAVLSDVLQGRAPGVLVQPGATGTTVASTRGRCRMGVYLDGTYSPSLTQDLDVLPTRDVAVVEVYRGVQVPVQYRPPGRAGSACGVVLVWTRFSTITSR